MSEAGKSQSAISSLYRQEGKIASIPHTLQAPPLSSCPYSTSYSHVLVPLYVFTSP